MKKKTIENTHHLEKLLQSIKIDETENKLDLLGDLATIMNKLSFKLKYNCLKIKDSPIHGLGVFATCDIPANKIVTFYPAHSVAIYHDGGKTTKIIHRSQEFEDNYDFYQNLYTLGDESKIFGDYEITGDPNVKDPLYLGHLLNDGTGNLFSGISYSDLWNDKNLAREILDEYKEKGNNNCYIEIVENFPICYIKTNRPIKSGTELLTTYGPIYWYGLEYKNVEHVEADFDKLKQLVYD